MIAKKTLIPVLSFSLSLAAIGFISTPSVFAATCDPNSLQTVAFGQSSPAVTNAQACLIEVGYSIPAGATGLYGGQTKTAVINFYASWWGPWDGMSIGPQGVTQLQSKVNAQRALQQQPGQQPTQPSGGTTTPTTNDTLPSIPGVSSLILTTQDLSQHTIYWAYANLAQNSNYSVNCSPNCGGSWPMSFNTSSTTSGTGQAPFTPPAPGTYAFNISATKGSDGTTPNAVQATLFIPGNNTLPVQQQLPGNPFGNVGGGLGCAGGGILPCFNSWILTSITPQLPNCSFGGSPNPLVPPQSATLSWTCSNAQSCLIDQGIGGVAAPSGSISVKPAKTTTYILSCSNPDGDNSFSTTITVAKPFIKEVRP